MRPRSSCQCRGIGIGVSGTASGRSYAKPVAALTSSAVAPPWTLRSRKRCRALSKSNSALRSAGHRAALASHALADAGRADKSLVDEHPRRMLLAKQDDARHHVVKKRRAETSRASARRCAGGRRADQIDVGAPVDLAPPRKKASIRLRRGVEQFERAVGEKLCSREPSTMTRTGARPSRSVRARSSMAPAAGIATTCRRDRAHPVSRSAMVRSGSRAPWREARSRRRPKRCAKPFM